MAVIRCVECKAKVSDKAAACPKCGAPIEVPRKKQKSWISTGCGCLVIVVAGVVLFALMLGRQKEPTAPPKQQAVRRAPRTRGPRTSAGIPSHRILDEDAYDGPGKTQVEVHALVTATATEEGVRALLRGLYEDAARMTGFKYHGGRPTNIYIYVYCSQEHFESGLGQWIGMISRSGADAEAKLTIRKEVIAQLGRPPVEKFGLSEDKRKEVFRLLVQAEDRAQREAEARYPLEPTDHLQVGQTFTLAKETPLMPEVEPADAMAALSRIRQLPSGARIKVTKVASKNGFPSYAVQAFAPSGSPIGSGWVSSVALLGQSKIDVEAQLLSQLELDDQLTRGYKDEISRQYGLTEDQLGEISVEGVTKYWPMPTWSDPATHSRPTE